MVSHLNAERIDVSRYRLPFRRAVMVAGVPMAERVGAMIRLTDPQGRVGFGEIAPLQGRHLETLDESLVSLKEGLSRGRPPTCPSAVFGLSCARAMAAREESLGLGTPPKGASIGINALFTGGAAEAQKMTREGLFAGFKTVKVKIGRARIIDDHAVIHALLEGLDSEVRLRLDGNRSFTLRIAQNLFKRLDLSRIEYVEEPLINPLELPDLHRLTGVTIAADESCANPKEREFVLGSPGIEVQVLKPSLLGTLDDVLDLITIGRIHGMDTVLSTAFESSFTIAMIARLASVASTGGRDHGLGTQGIFTQEFVDPWPIVEGRLQIDLPLPVPRLEFQPL
ncbi:MAG: o-succinylbenzoate synthase [Phycisphaerales bacterium]|nr:o-succinylbenzoate synthase [Phycisphaerales bacterium]